MKAWKLNQPKTDKKLTFLSNSFLATTAICVSGTSRSQFARKPNCGRDHRRTGHERDQDFEEVGLEQKRNRGTSPGQLR